MPGIWKRQNILMNDINLLSFRFFSKFVLENKWIGVTFRNWVKKFLADVKVDQDLEILWLIGLGIGRKVYVSHCPGVFIMFLRGGVAVF